MTTHDNPVLVALDIADGPAALALAEAVLPHVGGFKVGMELFYAAGPGLVRQLAGLGREIFLDLKLHDIPNTVAGAVRSVGPLGIRYLTVHAAGGAAMLAAAQDGATPFPDLRLLAVTVLTSLTEADLAEIGVTATPTRQVDRLAGLARRLGYAGIVCSPLEVARLRARLGADIDIVVPGIRPAGHVPDDQRRVMTPVQARDAGASRLVIGRPITASDDPVAAAAAIAADLGCSPPARAA